MESAEHAEILIKSNKTLLPDKEKDLQVIKLLETNQSGSLGLFIRKRLKLLLSLKALKKGDEY